MAELRNTVNYHQFEQSSPETVLVQKLETLIKQKCNYDINETKLVQDTNSFTLDSGLYHFYSIKILNGTADIIESGVTYTAPNGYEFSLESSSKFKNPITITGKSSGTIVVIKTLR